MRKALLTSIILVIAVLYSEASHILNEDSLSRPIFTFDQSVKVYDSTMTELVRAWSGGSRSPQFSELDVNNDGVKDLFLYDKMDHSISIFVYDAGTYVYQPDYESYFPRDLLYVNPEWILLRDYNCDGKNDIFADYFGNVQVWENTSTTYPSFTLATNPLTTNSSIFLKVEVPTTDIPNISDIDDDGDLDILAFGSVTPNVNVPNNEDYIMYYRNRSMDNTGACGLEFDVYTQCWGHFKQDSFSIVLNNDCGGFRTPIDTSTNGSTPLNGVQHSSIFHTLTVLDNDGDGDKDLIMGTTKSRDLKLLVNGGDINDAAISSVTYTYPPSTPAHTYLHNGVYLIDYDKDGDEDMVVSPADGSAFLGKNFQQNLLYQNTSTSSTPNFQFVQNDFVTDKAIEVGSGAAPKLYDYDFDGDMDLLIGNYSFKEDSVNGNTKVALYENIGSSDSAVFKMVDDNFANLKNDTLARFGKILTFGDLDGDGDEDMLVGEFFGNLKYYENTAGPGVKGVYSLVKDGTNGAKYQGINVGYNSAPELVDFDRDGDLDLLIGEQEGNVHYYRNNGSHTNANFVYITDSLGGIKPQNRFRGYSTPTVTDLNGNGNYDLVVGFQDNVAIYMDVEDYNLFSVYERQDSTYFNSTRENYTNLDFKERLIPTLANLDKDSFPEMLIGTYRGGVYFLKNNSDSSFIVNSLSEKIEEESIKVYPNPNKGNFVVELSNSLEDYQITIVNTVGQLCSFKEHRNNNVLSVQLENSAKGLYYIIIQQNNKIMHRSKLSVIK